MALPIRRARGRGSGLEVFELTDFSGGLNVDAEQFNLARNECPELVNMDIDGRGGLRRRRAVQAVTNSTDAPFDSCPRSLFGIESVGGEWATFVVAPAVVNGVNRLLWRTSEGGAVTPVATNFGLFDNGSVAGLQGHVRAASARNHLYCVWENPSLAVVGPPAEPPSGAAAMFAQFTQDPEPDLVPSSLQSVALSGRPQPFRLSHAGDVTLMPTIGFLDSTAFPTVTENGFTENYDFDPADAADGVDGIPDSRVVALHFGYLWVGNVWERSDPTSTSDAATNFRSRIRWSHPNLPERWRYDDYADINIGQDGDEITALIPFQDHLLVFKKNSIYGVYGDPPDNLSVVPLSRELGVLAQEQVVVTPVGVYFFDPNSGLWRWDGTQFVWLYKNLDRLLRDNTIPAARRHNVRVGWVRNRVWVGVPTLQSSLPRSRTYIFDPFLGKDGAWTSYDLGLGPFLTQRRRDGSHDSWAGCRGTQFLQRLEVDSDFDLLDPTEGPTPIVGSVRTAWVNRQPGAVKTWRRPDVVLSTETALLLQVDVYTDYATNSQTERKRFVLSTSDSGADLIWATPTGDEPLDHEWDDKDWASRVYGTTVERGASLGKSRAVSLRFESAPTVAGTWRLDSIMFKFRARKVRG